LPFLLHSGKRFHGLAVGFWPDQGIITHLVYRNILIKAIHNKDQFQEGFFFCGKKMGAGALRKRSAARGVGPCHAG
jgi:hypothetical protein